MASRARACAAAAYQRKRPCIDDLPNEMLYEIFRYLDRDRPRQFPLFKRRLSIYDTMMSVSRRWRSVAIPFLWHFIVHKDVDDFWDHWKTWPEDFEDFDPSSRPLLDWGDKKTASLVQHLRVGPYERTVQGRKCNPESCIDLAPEADIFPFRNLLVLENVACMASPEFLAILPAACPRLQELAIAWEIHSGFPEVEWLQSVRVLRVFISFEDAFTLGDYTFSPQTFRNITTLHMRGMLRAATIRDHIELCCSMTFPRLQVLRFERIMAGAPDIYDFISRHPSLLEVNLDFFSVPGASLRLEALVKLINGTGIWKKRADTYGVVLDQPSFREFTPDMPIPPNFDMAYGYLWQVAFKRVSLPEPFRDADAPRYKCTGVALNFCESEDDDDFFEELGYDFRDAIDFVHAIKAGGEALSCFEDIEELVLKCDHYQSGALGFAEIMDFLGCGLRRLKKLRRLAIHFSALNAPVWTSDSLDITYTFRRPELVDGAGCELGFIPFMDEVCPRAFEWSLTGGIEPATLRTLYTSRCPISSVLEAVRDALRLDADEYLEEDDESLLLRAWEARNHTKMERIVGRLAKACPTLDRFEWWVLDEGHPEGVLHWDWKISQPALASSGRRSLGGNLTWAGCGKGTPPEFPLLVGEELEYQYSHSWGRSRPL